MSGFEDFLQQSVTPQAPAAPSAPPSLGANTDALSPPDDFGKFLAKVKGEQDTSTVQQAQATSVANAHSGISADAAGQAAKTGRELGVPQAAVETDIPTYQATAKAQKNAGILSTNPVLAKWVAANPDSARIAQDEYEKLGAVEKLWDTSKDTAYTGLQSLGHGFASAALGLNRALEPWLGLVGAGDVFHRNITAPSEETEKSLRLPPDASFLQKAAAVPGELASLLAQVTLTGGAGAAADVTAGVGATIANAATHAGKAMAFPSLTASANTAHDVYAQTNDPAAAARAAAGSYLFSTLQGAVPFSAPGTLATRALSGAVSGAATSEGNRAAMNLLVPQTARNFDPQEAIFQALSGAVLGGVMGPHADVNLREGIRQTYADALKASQAETDLGKVEALGKIAAESKLRENDPDAFHKFVESVTDKSELDAVYVDAVKLSEAFAQSEVKPTDSLAQDMSEALKTGGDVRIPIADYATHLAGTDIEKAILPEMKASADGMTMKEGQDFYAKAAENMKAKAKEMTDAKQEQTDLDTDKQGVFQTLHDQMVAAGRDPGIAHTEATLATEFYSSMAAREGMKPSEFLKANPLAFTADATEGLAQGERGAFNPDTHTISLLKGADLTTVTHELGHSFLDTLSHVAVGEKASEGVKTDFKTLLDWFGVKDEASWHAMSLDEQRPFHEKLAKGFERYMFEGKAPTQALQPIFSRIRAWMLNVYQKLSNLGGEINPEVRGVFDRMLASDEAIKQAEQIRSYAPLFTDAKAFGGDEAKLQAYLKLGQEATSDAVDSMQARSMRDMKWLSNAKNKAIRAMQKEALSARKEVQAEAEHEVAQRPVYAARDFMRANPGSDKEIVAGMHGFDSAEAMQHEMDQAGPRKEAVRQLTDQKMLQRHGELTDPAAVELAANDAIHNEARARFMATGLKILTDSPLPANQIAKAANEAAQATIAGKAVGDLRSDRYLAAEAKANKEAIKQAAKSPEKAVDAQRAAILNNRLAKAAMDAQAEVQKGLDYLKKFDKPTITKAVGGEYMDRINELLSSYDLTNRFSTGSDVAQRQQFRDWLNSEYAKTGVMPEVSDALLDFAQTKHWKELKVEEFRGLVDAVKSLEHVGREQTLVTVNDKRVGLDELVAEAKENTKDLPHNAPVDIQPHLEHAKGLEKIGAQYLKFKSRLRDGDASLLKMEQLFQWLEVGQRAGFGEFTHGAFSKMFTKAAKAESVERQMRKDAVTDVRALQAKLADAKVNLDDALQVNLPREGRNTHWFREELLAAALNTGNTGPRSNMEKLTKGYGWTESQVRTALNEHLSKPEWDFVQGVWDMESKYAPLIEAQQKRLAGVAPPMVKPTPFDTPHGRYEGGYHPVVFDAFADSRIEQKGADRLFEQEIGNPSTNKGHTIERTGYVGPLYMSLKVIGRHIDQVTHDLAWREPIIDMNKFLSHPEIKSEIDQTMGKEYTAQLRPWLKAMANDKVFNTTGDSFWERTIRTVRANTTIVGLGFRASTIEVHGGSALSNSIGEIGMKWMAKGAAQFMGPDRWGNAKQFVYDRSPEMANRMNEWDRNVHDAIDDINRHAASFGPTTLAQKWVDGARKFAFYGVSMSDMASAMPTWHGAYLKGLAKEKGGGLNLSEDLAIEYANRAVRNAHGGGGVKDLAAVQRSKGVASLATLFYSYWNHMYQRQRDLAKGYGNLPNSFREGTGTKDFARLLARSWWYFVVPQLIHAIVKGDDSKDNDGSIGHYLGHIAKEVAIGPFGGIPIVRDLVNAAVNGHDYAATPLEAAGKALVKSATDAYKFASGEEPSKHAVANAANVVGYTFGLPTGQASQTGKFLWDVYHGEADPQGIREWAEGISTGKIRNK